MTNDLRVLGCRIKAGFAGFALALACSAPALAQGNDAAGLAKAAQNPIAAMISVPLQYNINFDTGPLDGTQHLLNIQPVYPIDLNSEWNLITRTIVPVISQPAFAAGRTANLGSATSSSRPSSHPSKRPEDGCGGRA